VATLDPVFVVTLVGVLLVAVVARKLVAFVTTFVMPILTVRRTVAVFEVVTEVAFDWFPMAVASAGRTSSVLE
jgi:hypothetical protein